MCYNCIVVLFTKAEVNKSMDGERKKLVMSQKKYQGDSSVVSVRLPDEMLMKIDEIASKSGRTRNEIIHRCIEFALENIEIT